MSPLKDFPLTPLSDALVSGAHDTVPTFTDVHAAFNDISPRGDPFSAQDGALFPPYTYTPEQDGDLNEARNHFQGVARLRRGKYLVVSGGFATGKRKGSHLFVVRMGSRPADGIWGSNVVLQAEPGSDDTTLHMHRLHSSHWHAGGLSLLGDILAVPLEGGASGSQVAFLHAKDPEALERFAAPTAGGSLRPLVIDRPDIDKAGAVALTKLADGRYLCAVWHEVSKAPRGRIDFYLSRDGDFVNGFDPRPVSWAAPKPSGLPDKRDPQYQHISLLTEDRGGQRRLFLVGMENGSGAAPFGNGPNFADLWQVDVSTAHFTPGAPPPALALVDSREFRGLREYSNFDAACGCYVAPAGTLHLYSAHHWRILRSLRLSEFSARPPATATVGDLKDGFIELYSAKEYRGRRLAIYGDREATLADYGALFVEGGDFDEGVLSAKVHLPAGAAYALYPARAFGGTPFELRSPGGQRREWPDLAASGVRHVLSSRYV